MSGSKLSSPPRCLRGILKGVGDQDGKTPPFSAKPAQHLPEPIWWASWGAGTAGASLGAGMLMLVLTFPGHCCRSAAWTCVRLLQPRHPQHGGNHCQPSGAAHRNRMHRLSVHHSNAAVRVSGTSLPLSLVPVWLFLSCPLHVPYVMPGEIPFYHTAAVHPPACPSVVIASTYCLLCQPEQRWVIRDTKRMQSKYQLTVV